MPAILARLCNIWPLQQKGEIYLQLFFLHLLGLTEFSRIGN
jgi:hypothetical protein